MHDKTFFYLASEAYRQVWGYPVSGDVPSAAFKATIPSSSPVYGIVNAYPGAGPKTFLTPYTPANDPGDPNYADYDLLTCSCTQVVNENSALLRIDQHFSAKTTAFMRFNYDRSVDTQPVSTSATNLEQRVSAPVNGVLELLHIFGPTLTNEVKFGFNRPPTTPTTPVHPTPFIRLRFPPVLGRDSAPRTITTTPSTWATLFRILTT